MYYLGKYGSDSSRREYDRIIAEFVANGRRAFYDPDMLSLSDWDTNASQYVYGRATQYYKAMEIGLEVHNQEIIDSVIFTGHSLGGGLASAATFFAIPDVPGGYNRQTTYTFNAAFCWSGTGDSFINLDSTRQIHMLRFSKNYFNAQTNIFPYIVDGEALNYIQEGFLETPANGRKKNVAGNWTGGHILPRDANLTLESSVLNPIGTLWVFSNRGNLHKTSAIFWGFERAVGIR
jgi:hypothetical protein